MRRLLPPLVMLLLAGCAASPEVVRAARPAPIPPTNEAVWVAPAADLRPAPAAPRLLGSRQHNVGSGQRPLLLDRPVAGWVTERLMATLADRGLHPRLIEGPGRPAVWLEPRIESLALTVATSDRFDLALALRLHRDGREVWSQSRAFHESRFTGVGGTAPAHLVALLQTDVERVWGDLLTAMATTEQPPATTGRVELASTPAGAQIYLDGIYYGTTPLAVDLPPGIHDLRLVLPPAPPINERLAVAGGRTIRYQATVGTGGQP